jgi:hypothetical protein
VRELARKRLTGQTDALFVRVDRVHRSGSVRDLQRQAAVAAPELEHVQPVHRCKLPKGADLDRFRIDLHQPILACGCHTTEVSIERGNVAIAEATSRELCRLTLEETLELVLL